MSSFEDALLSFVKQVGVVDMSSTSFRDISDVQEILDTFYQLFHVDSSNDDESQQVKQMIRWLHQNAPKNDQVKEINIDSLIDLDHEEIENVFTLMYNCKSVDENNAEEFTNIMDQLDEDERNALQGSNTEDKTEEYEALATQIREFVKVYDGVQKSQKLLDELNNKKNDLQNGLSDSLEQEEHDQREKLNQQKETIIEKREANNKLLQEIEQLNNVSDLRRDGPSRDELVPKVGEMQEQITSILQQIDHLHEVLTELESLREKKANFNDQLAPLKEEFDKCENERKAAQDLLDSKKARIEEKNHALDEERNTAAQELQSLKEQQENHQNQFKSNLDTLNNEKTNGGVGSKLQQVMELRKQRDELKQKIDAIKARMENIKSSVQSDPGFYLQLRLNNISSQ